MYSYRSLKERKGFITIQILIIFSLILFLESMLFKLSTYKLQKADLERKVIENSIKQVDNH